EARRPRIADPVSGTIFALDPDIPIDRQRIRVTVKGAAANHRLLLDKRDIGRAEDSPLILAGPGRHALTLVDAEGRAVDRVLFQQR
ncbi:MAG TPA: penicillin-binding protein 1C, partial [Sphingomonadaceae bacterium]|nr:penicillin-binding protein 1C [Sphingomonadaceae bacterium]